MEGYRVKFVLNIIGKYVPKYAPKYASKRVSHVQRWVKINSEDMIRQEWEREVDRRYIL